MTVTWTESSDLNSAILNAILSRMSGDLSQGDAYTSESSYTNKGASSTISTSSSTAGFVIYHFNATLSNDNEHLTEIKIHDAGGTEYIDYSLSSSVALGNSANDDIYFEVEIDVTDIVWAN